MPRNSGQGDGQIALVDTAEANEAARRVDQQLIPDAARVAKNHLVSGEIEIGRQIGNDIFGVIGDAARPVEIDQGNDIAVDAAGVSRAELVLE